MKECETEKKKNNKRKRTASISPQQKRSGRPSTNETLTKLANSEIDNDQISPQELILRALDGSEKKKKLY
jgi:hypothetical protein